MRCRSEFRRRCGQRVETWVWAEGGLEMWVEVWNLICFGHLFGK